MSISTILRQSFRSVRAIYYMGNNVECPCCGGKYRRFLPANGRQNALCPGCFSLERHRALWLYLSDKFSKPMKLLHVAPETCLSTLIKRIPNLDYISGDLYNPAMVRLDVTDIQFDDNTFDAILCNHVLEHVPDDRKAMRELYRVLKPGGWAILQVPIRINKPTYEDDSITSPEERRRHFGQEDHVRYYGYDYPDRLANAGFTVNVVDYADQINKSDAERYRTNLKTKIFVAVKDSV